MSRSPRENGSVLIDEPTQVFLLWIWVYISQSLNMSFRHPFPIGKELDFVFKQNEMFGKKRSEALHITVS